MTAPTSEGGAGIRPVVDSWGKQREKMPRPRLPRGSFPAAFLTFSVLLLLFAVGFVVGRMVVAPAYVRAGPEVEKRPGGGRQQPSGKAGTEWQQGAVRVPEAYQGGAGEASGSAEQGSTDTAAEGNATSPPSSSEGATSESGEPLAGQAGTPGSAEPGSAEASTGGHAPTENASKRYVLQAGVFGSRQAARNLVDKLTRAGYPARIEPDRSGAQTTYRVLSGRYGDEQKARQDAERLRADGFDVFVAQR